MAAGGERRAPVTVHYHHYNELPPIKPVALPPIPVYDSDTALVIDNRIAWI